MPADSDGPGRQTSRFTRARSWSGTGLGAAGPGRLSACGDRALGSGLLFTPPAPTVVRPFGRHVQGAPELGVMCAPTYPRPFAGREEDRQGELRRCGARARSGARPWLTPGSSPAWARVPAGSTPTADSCRARLAPGLSRGRLRRGSERARWKVCLILVQILRLPTLQYPSPRSGQSMLLYLIHLMLT